jgi:hypothetical protein|tara:strand:+ start:686 stop:889 length:204 start_codon:yes stop_codon:yes gene_type:complete
MTKKQMKTWKDACDKEEKEKGYVPAELLMLPMFFKMHKKGLVDIAQTEDDFIVIKSKEKKNVNAHKV